MTRTRMLAVIGGALVAVVVAVVLVVVLHKDNGPTSREKFDAAWSKAVADHPEIAMLDRKVAYDAAVEVCDNFDNGMSVDTEIGLMIEMKPANVDDATNATLIGTLLGVSVKSICPEHADKAVDFFNRLYRVN